MDRGQEVRELKLGASFTNPNSRSVFHTLKYDFKPASVDVHKEATLETGSNNTVTVTLPHLDGSGVPNTIFKGNQRDYTKKECILVINRETNEITLERLHSNVQVKKTRTDSSNKSSQQQQQMQLQPQQQSTTGQMQMQQQQIPSIQLNNNNSKVKTDNVTARHSSKTRVSTGVRKNNMNNILNFVPKNSPTLQGSPSYPHRSPQQAPLWNANNTQQTLPSIPSLLDDNNFTNNQAPSSSSTSSVYSNNKSNNVNVSNNLMALSSIPKASGNLMVHQQQQSAVMDDIGELSSSSSSDSNDDDSDSDSDSGDSSTNNHPTINNSNNGMMSNNNNNNSNHNKVPVTAPKHLANSTALLQNDLRLSDSNSDSDDHY